MHAGCPLPFVVCSEAGSPINPVELAGSYLHINPMPAFLQPGHNDRRTRVKTR